MTFLKWKGIGRGGSFSLFGFCSGTFDYRSGMYTFSVICLFFLTDLLLWLGKGSTRAGSKSQRNERKRWQTSRVTECDDKF